MDGTNKCKLLVRCVGGVEGQTTFDASSGVGSLDGHSLPQVDILTVPYSLKLLLVARLCIYSLDGPMVCVKPHLHFLLVPSVGTWQKTPMPVSFGWPSSGLTRHGAC